MSMRVLVLLLGSRYFSWWSTHALVWVCARRLLAEEEGEKTNSANQGNSSGGRDAPRNINQWGIPACDYGFQALGAPTFAVALVRTLALSLLVDERDVSLMKTVFEPLPALVLFVLLSILRTWAPRGISGPSWVFIGGACLLMASLWGLLPPPVLLLRLLPLCQYGYYTHLYEYGFIRTS